MITPDARDKFLEAGWLADLDSAARQTLLGLLVERREEAGSALLTQGQANDLISFLIEGEVEVVRQGQRGNREPLTRLAAPTVFGLISFFRPAPPEFTVRALTAVRRLTLDHDAWAVLRRLDARASEQLSLAAVRILADRFEALERRITDELASHPADHPRRTEWAQFRARLFDESHL